MSEKSDLRAAVLKFAEVMISRLESKRLQGWHGWENVNRKNSADRLLMNAAKGSVNNDKISLVDAANLAMMIYRNER